MPSRNLFTPAFGGLPQVFFGRTRELEFAKRALDDQNSPHRAFFITGNRGCGKTTLLEKISSLGADRGWLNVDVHSAHASRAIIDVLAGGSQHTIQKNASPSALGVSVGSISSTTTTTYEDFSLAQLLLRKCHSMAHHKGILITVDEIQKVPEEDAENLCASVQLALRKGLPVMLVLAGLPGSKEKVAAYPGCTFMQRAYDMQIGCLQVDETIYAYKDIFNRMPHLQIDDDAIWEAGRFSQGYPYLMQLLGYYAVERVNDRTPYEAGTINIKQVREVEPIALEAFRANVLAPILDSLSTNLTNYLRAMCEAEDEQGRIRTGEVALLLGKKQSQVSSYRKRLIDRRLIEPDGHGYVLFLLPHVREYYRGQQTLERKDPAQQWNRYR